MYNLPQCPWHHIFSSRTPALECSSQGSLRSQADRYNTKYKLLFISKICNMHKMHDKLVYNKSLLIK